MWQSTSSQLIRALRAERSQRVFSMRLGYAGNPVKNWEAGRRFPTAGVALRAAKRVGVDVAQAGATFQLSATRLGDLSDENIAAWLNGLRGRRTFVDIAKASNLSRQQVARWLTGKSVPRLPEFLHLLDTITGRVSDFVAELVDIGQVPALLDAHRKRCAAKNLAYIAPWTEAVMRVIETQAYQELTSHEPGWIAKRLGISNAVEQDCIEKMLASGTLAYSGEQLRPTEVQTVSTASDPKKAAFLKQHWGSVVMSPPGASVQWTGYNVISLSQKDLENVEETLKKAYAEIRSIVANSQPEETVALVHLNLLKWNI